MICNIDKTDRINRIVFGVILLLGVLLGAGKIFVIIVSIILIIEGVIGWCGIPGVVAKLKHYLSSHK